MFKKKEKIGTSLGVGRLENRVLNLFRSDTEFEGSLISLKRVDRKDVCGASQREIRNAMLETEHQKAKALMTLQNYRRFY